MSAVAYTSDAELRARFGSAEIDLVAERDAAGVDAAIARAIADASAEIDAYISARHALPLPTVPPVLARIACDMARYRLWHEQASEEVRVRYEDARRFLERIASGAVRLGVPEAQQPAAPAGLSAARSGAAGLFDRASTLGY